MRSNGLRDGSLLWCQREEVVVRRLTDGDSPLAQNRAVGVHNGDAPIAGIDAATAVRPVTGTSCLDSEADIVSQDAVLVPAVMDNTARWRNNPCVEIQRDTGGRIRRRSAFPSATGD